MNKSYLLQLNSNIEVITKEGKRFIHNKTKQEIYGLNAVGSLLIELISNKQTLNQLIESLAKKYKEVDQKILEKKLVSVQLLVK